jgi:hypothetical protein
VRAGRSEFKHHRAFNDSYPRSALRARKGLLGEKERGRNIPRVGGWARDPTTACLGVGEFPSIRVRRGASGIRLLGEWEKVRISSAIRGWVVTDDSVFGVGELPLCRSL